MPDVLDLNILPIQRHGGQDQSDFPGLYAAAPPRRTARGRDQDNLVLYLSLQGGDVVPAEQQVQWLTRLAQTFYKTPGAVTSALRLLADILNKSLLERNVHHTGSQAVGLLTLMVMRGDSVTLAHSGFGHSVVLTPNEIQDFTDEEGKEHGLGLSRTPSLRFFQFSLHSNEFVLLTHQSAEDWQLEGLRIAPNQGMEGLRRRLLVGRSEPELDAVLIQAVTGTGKLRFLRVKTPLPEMARPQPAAANDQSQLATGTTPEGTSTLAPAESVILLPGPSSPVEPAQPLAGGEPEAIQPVSQQVPAESATAGTAVTPPENSSPAPAVQAPIIPETAIPQKTGMPEVKPPLEDRPAPEKKKPQAVKESAVPAVNRPTRTPASPASTRRPSTPSALKRLASTLLKSVASALQLISNVLRQVGRALLAFIRRVLPDENMLNISPKTLAFIAIAVPILVSVVGGMVYLERGQASQYQQFYTQAVQASTQASEKTDPVEQRLAWQSTLDMLDKAELYRLTPESQALRQLARTSLDTLDGIERLDFQSVLLGNLDKTINITKLVVVGGDLYMLNGTQGNVIRAVLTGGGYQIDSQFICGPIAGGVAVVGPLMDIVAMPRGDENGATLIGIDASGTSILCIPGEPPLLQPVTPPGVNFSEIRAMDVNMGDLYLLDPGLSAVWIYRGMDTVNPPRLFFGEEVPAVQDVVDMMVNNDDLYLLHADGHVTLCTYEYNVSETITRCEDTLNFVDLRPGRNGGPVIPDALFSHIQFAPPPDPSLFMLDPENQAIYHFSLRLAFQRQFRPITPLSSNPATAFVISTNRIAFMAVGNRVYSAALP